MSLPVYNHISFNQTNIDDLGASLKPDLNGRHPVAFNLLELDSDQQRETIGLIENFFDSNNLSFKYPYPVYLISIHEKSITQMPLVKRPDQLPKFFSQKEGRMNVKEGHVIGKNRLLQQEIKNTDASLGQQEIENYARVHREIFEHEKERVFLKDILTRLVKGKING